MNLSNKTIQHNKHKSDKNQSSIKNVFSSVAAAFFGVQSDKNRKRDFSEGKFIHFAIAGAILVVIFITLLIGIVSLVLPN